jgi:hypothetical protein
MTTQTTAIDHVDVIVADIQDHIDKKSDFVGFILISIGIEYLGAFMDAKSFTDFGQSEVRFKNGLSFFKNKWYQNNSEFLFKNFRGPLIHQYRIGHALLLTSICKNGAPLNYHLTELEGGRIFVLEQLFEDYKDAIRRFKNEATKPGNSFNKEKMGLTHQTIIQIPTKFPQHIPSSGSTISQPVPMPTMRKDIEINTTLSSGSPL